MFVNILYDNSEYFRLFLYKIINYIHFLPKELNINGTLYPEIRYRSIYETVLYNAKLTIEGSFSYPDSNELSILQENILWHNASISLGISDMKGIKESIAAKINEQEIFMNPGINPTDVMASGVSCKIMLPVNSKDISFKFEINLNGSEEINFIPVGKTTNISINSTWNSPSFTGEFLPVKRNIDEKGFTAEWKILHLNRNYPQQWVESSYQIYTSAFGVKLFIVADIYQKSMRTVKYAIMFILFTFTGFFFSEIINKKRLHPIQYLLIGFTIIIFYTLLISISEHINFNIAYLMSSASIILLITGYSKGILGSKYLSLTVFGMLTVLYGYLYIVLQLEDYALLMGSIGLFVVLSLIMYVTRNIDWYSLNFKE
ncbi:MAG: cell envelope integrity protein CreD [Desulfobacterales bacterium]|nr:cell envelope integrity protein CreD [Desulfobacterales bacterium]